MTKFAYPTVEEFQRMSAADFESFWDAFDKLGMAKQAPFAGRWFLGRHDIRDMITLKRAGWKPEPASKLTEPMSWFWRRPLRTGTRDRKGQRYNSTGQAIGELRRMEAQGSTGVESFEIEMTYDGKTFSGYLPAKGHLNAQRLADAIGARLVSAWAYVADPKDDTRLSVVEPSR